jgi:FAD/FMN-containing dehydrogenase
MHDMTQQSGNKWSNWSGSLQFEPQGIEKPAGEEAVRELVRRAATDGLTLRAEGAGHSSMPLLGAGDTLVSSEKLRGLLSSDAAAGTAVLGPGTVIREAGELLHEVGLAMENMGDIDRQTIGGAIGTGTHGTGRSLPNLSGQLVGGRLVVASGDVIELADEPELLEAARVSLGALGMFTALELRVLPSYRLLRREWCTHTDDCMAHLDELVDTHRNFDFYWYPRSDVVKLRTWEPPDDARADIPFASLADERTGWSYEVLPNEQELRFDETEWAVPAEAGPACFQAARTRIKARHRHIVGWRLLYRTVRADDGWISPMHGRDSVTISIHQNTGLPYEEYFADMEAVFREHDGRPHWGKKHGLTAAALRPLYPMWDRFQEVRRRLDPDGIFLNDYLRRLLGE